MNRTLRRSLSLATAAALIAGSVAWYGVAPARAQTPPPPANARLTPSPVTTTGTVVLTWDPAPADTEVAYYQIFRSRGAGTPVANELTYLGRTEDTRAYFIDQLPTEGTFQFAVMAVGASSSAGQASAWAAVTVDLPGNGSGTIEPDGTAPASVSGSTVGEIYSRNRTLVLNWTAPGDSDLWRYLVYRADAGQGAKLAGYVEAGTTAFTETVTQDGPYAYTVVAQDLTGNASAPSTAASVLVDTEAPAVQVTVPIAGQSFAGDSSFTITTTVAESGAGYDASAARYYLDNTLLASPVVNLSGAAAGNHAVRVEVTDRAGNTGTAEVQFIVTVPAGAPSAPRNLSSPTYSRARSFPLTWAAPEAGSVTRYTVYRFTAGGAVVVAGHTQPDTRQLTDTVAADGAHHYFVIAENGALAGPASNVLTVTADTVAPAIAIAAPGANLEYEPHGTLAVQVTVTDATSGYEPSEVKLFLNGQPFTGSAIDLAQLAEGSHTFRVETADRAGNTAAKELTFQVGEATNEDDEDEVDAARPDLADLLTSLKSQIHHGHYTALMAKVRNGNLKSFKSHVQKHRGKFIAPVAADKLLKALEPGDN